MLDRPAHDQVRVSVVIATLGGESLKSTIDHLNASSIVPAEILVCIPEDEAHRLADYSYPNLKIVVTHYRGQVAQRAVGFSQVSYEFVMQLDDDIVVDTNCLELLIRDLNMSGPRCAIAPALRWLGNRQSVYKQLSPPSLSRIFYWLLNGRSGYRPGIVTKAGAEIGVHSSANSAGVVDAEWLPGGCVLHRRGDLVLENYFPLQGKAYCEDLIHSFYLRSRGVRLLVSRDATAYIDEPAPESLWSGHFFQTLRADFRARRYYVELSSRSKLRMYLFYFARAVRHLVK